MSLIHLTPKPEPLEAMQWTGDNFDLIKRWAEDAVHLDQARRPGGSGKLTSTLEVWRDGSVSRVPHGWWLVRMAPANYVVFGPHALAEAFEDPEDTTETGERPCSD